MTRRRPSLGTAAFFLFNTAPASHSKSQQIWCWGATASLGVLEVSKTQMYHRNHWCATMIYHKLVLPGHNNVAEIIDDIFVCREKPTVLSRVSLSICPQVYLVMPAKIECILPSRWFLAIKSHEENQKLSSGNQTWMVEKKRFSLMIFAAINLSLLGDFPLMTPKDITIFMVGIQLYPLQNHHVCWLNNARPQF